MAGHDTDTRQWMRPMLVLGALLLVACSSNAPSPQRAQTPSSSLAPSPAPTPSGAPTLVTFVPSGAGTPSTAIVGRLGVRGGCVVVVGRDGTAFLAVWPVGYRWSRESSQQAWIILDPSGKQVAAMGRNIQIGGGIIDEQTAENLSHGDLPTDCKTGSYLMINGPA